MFAQRYGTLPVGHATGGLLDTIDNASPFHSCESGIGVSRGRYRRSCEAVISMIRVWGGGVQEQL